MMALNQRRGAAVRLSFSIALAVLATCWAGTTAIGRQAPVRLPADQLTFGAFTARFDPAGTFTLEGGGWPTLGGTWTLSGDTIEMRASAPKPCPEAGRYRVQVEGNGLRFELVTDACEVRRMILSGSTWGPASDAKFAPPRAISLTTGGRVTSRPAPDSQKTAWPSFRGPDASGVAEGQQLPDLWNGTTGQHVIWKTPIPGLAHSSPVVWGERLFVTSAISARGNASFKPGLYGDGDASDDRSSQRWMIYAIDARTGKMLWEQVAHEGVPRDKRHIKSTYASATPATDGRIVVAWFGSQGVHAYDVDGHILWRVDLGRVDVGAYDIPTYEWGPASSPIIWNGLVILQCDTQTDSFLLALDADTGATVWKTDREELPSWGTPTVVPAATGPELVTNASNFIRAYDPRTGRELWRLGRSSKITAPTPIFVNDRVVVASGRGPEKPIFVVKAGSRGDLTLAAGQTNSDSVLWSRTARGPYMPTPLIYRGLLYVLGNNGVFDAYDLASGKELYRQRLPNVVSGFSASPVASDGKLYLSSEDGDMLVVAAGPEFRLISTNTMGESLMATPALSSGVMYVRSSGTLFAIGQRR